MKLLFLAPISSLSQIHINRPFFELPRAVTASGGEGILIAGKVNVLYPEGLKIYETGVGTDRQIDIINAFGKVVRVLEAERPDIVIFFHMNLLMSAFILLYDFKKFLKGDRKNNKRTIWALKLDWDGSKFQEIGSSFMKLRNLFLSFNSLFLDYVITENSCAMHASEVLPFVNDRKLRIIPNTFSSNFPLTDYRNGRRENTILCVARISPEKGIEILIKSFLRVLALFPSWSLKIVGPIDDGNYLNFCKSLIPNGPPESRIHFTGPVYETELREIYSTASIFCLPSHHESFAIVRCEAIASGLPLITTSAGCGNDFEKYGSIVVPVGDIDSLTNALLSLMNDETLRIEICTKQQSKYPDYSKVVQYYQDLVINDIVS